MIITVWLCNKTLELTQVSIIKALLRRVNTKSDLSLEVLGSAKVLQIVVSKTTYTTRISLGNQLISLMVNSPGIGSLHLRLARCCKFRILTNLDIPKIL